jgi:hypothetical protein
MAGSLVAGVCAGYLSHVPHNMSTMKLLAPRLCVVPLPVLEHHKLSTRCMCVFCSLKNAPRPTLCALSCLHT